MNNESLLLMITAITIGFIHTILGPDHYLPFLVLSKARKWSISKTLGITFLCGLGHVLSSIVLGIIGITLGIAVFKLEAIESFLFVPNKVTKSGSHIRDHIDMKRTMIVVMMAAIPALLFGMYNTGYQHFLSIGADPGFWPIFFHGFLKVLPIIVVAYVAGLGTEIIVAQMRGHEVFEGFFVTGFLIPLILPADVPLWMVAVATIFAVIFGKEVFGGTGMNIVNPALLTRAFLFFAYPTRMSGDLVF